jgi:hypothetical protein
MLHRSAETTHASPVPRGSCLVDPISGAIDKPSHPCFARGVTTAFPLATLAAADWHPRAARHRERAARFTVPARQRKDRRLPHPVADFLFQYYPFPLSLLEHWHSGIGVALEWQGEPRPPFADRHHVFTGGMVFADPATISGKERERLGWIVELLESTAARPPQFSCHGLHEWAMVYQGAIVRHEKTMKLRLPQKEIDTLVESRPIRCSHHDAFRFFAPSARGFNQLQPLLETRHLMEQPGCLHANMDLYKWAAKTMPWCGSDLLLDCFELASALRDLDMRASPYDVSEWGLKAVPIETPEGRRTYETEQKHLASLAEPIRARLIAALRRTLEGASS